MILGTHTFASLVPQPQAGIMNRRQVVNRNLGLRFSENKITFTGDQVLI